MFQGQILFWPWKSKQSREEQCPNGQIHCPNGQIHCPNGLIFCQNSLIICPNGQVTCSNEQVYCPNGQVNCPNGLIYCLNGHHILQDLSTFHLLFQNFSKIKSRKKEKNTQSILSYLFLESPILQCNFTSNFILDCSKLKLSAIPKNIPNTTVHLNLSHNSLQQIDDDAFDECCENVKVLNLSHNEISTLNRRHFENMKNLEVIFLDSNRFTEFDADTFQSLKNLKQLNLNRNSIELKGSSTRGFLIQSSLEELNLENCKIDEIPDSAFVNMTQLERLSLAGNPLDESLDTDAFVPLTNLIKLRIPNLTQSTIYQICDKLTAIDIISFDEFNVSCTVLSDNQAFDEAIILNDPVELPKVQSLSPPITRKPTTTEAATSSATAMTLPAANETSTDALKPQIETSDGDATNKTKIDMGTAAIDIDNSTIKFILVGESSDDDAMMRWWVGELDWGFSNGNEDGRL